MSRTRTNTRSLLLLPSLIVASICFAQQQKPKLPQVEKQDDDVVRIDTALVTVTVNAKQRHGKGVPSLKREDFHLYEDGVEQEVVYFESPKELEATKSTTSPFTVALLLDVSDSTEFKVAQIRQAAIAFIDQLQADDRVLVVAFDKRVQILAEATNNRKDVREAINRIHTGGGTSLYSAIEIVLGRLRTIAGRKAIVLFTDGVDTASIDATIDRTVAAAERSDAAIYPIQYNTYGDFIDNPSRQTGAAEGLSTTAHATKNGELASEVYKRGTNYLRLLAERTGGSMQYSDSIKNLSRSFTRIVAKLRQQYTLGYYPKNRVINGTQRQIKVRVDVPEVEVSTRKSYVFAPR